MEPGEQADWWEQYERPLPRFPRHPRSVFVLPLSALGAVSPSCTLLVSLLQGLAPAGTGASHRWSRGGRRLACRLKRLRHNPEKRMLCPR